MRLSADSENNRKSHINSRRRAENTQLLSERAAPDLVCLETKFASLMSYGLTVELLGEILPLGSQINTIGVRRRLQQVAERIESELGEEHPHFVEGCGRDWDQLWRKPQPLSEKDDQREPWSLVSNFVRAADKAATEYARRFGSGGAPNSAMEINYHAC